MSRINAASAYYGNDKSERSRKAVMRLLTGDFKIRSEGGPDYEKVASYLSPLNTG